MSSTADLTMHFLEAVDQAAIASAAWRGKGDKNAADDAAVEAMRRTFDAVPFDGRVAIGEGERDEAPMLFIGEELGSAVGVEGVPCIDIAVDPLECTNNCADDKPNSIAVLAAAPRGTLLHAPDCYMNKIAAGPQLAGHVSLEGTVTYNLEQTAQSWTNPSAMSESLPLIVTDMLTCSRKSVARVHSSNCLEMVMYLVLFGRQRMMAHSTCSWALVLRLKV